MKTLHKTILTKYLPLPAVVLLSFSAQAETRINGFANFVAGQTLSSDESTVDIDFNEAYIDDLSFDTDSLFAIQVSTDITDKVTATAQLLGRGRQDFDVGFEWAYISYEATDNLTLNFGRLRAPFFRYSDSADIGFSYHWITAPSSVYDVGFNNLNGFRLDYSNYVGDWEYILQAAGGTYESDFAGGELSGKNTLVFTAETTYEWFKARAVWGRATATYVGNEGIDETIATAELFSSEVADALRVEDDTGIFVGVGLEADFYTWFVGAEYTTVDQKNAFAGKDEAFYVTAGARIGKFTPSITYEELDGTGSIQNGELISQITDPTTQAILSAINTGLQEGAFDKTSRVTATIRYEFDTSIAVKADIQKFTDDLVETNDATIVRVAINYIF